VFLPYGKRERLKKMSNTGGIQFFIQGPAPESLAKSRELVHKALG